MPYRELNADIYVLMPEGKIADGFVWVGNTGLKIDVFKFNDDFDWIQHYTPDGYKDQIHANRRKNSLVYPYGLYHLVKWWQNQSNFDPRTFPRQDVLIGETNLKMHQFRRRLLGDHIYREKPTLTGEYDRSYDKVINDSYEYTLDLRILADNHPIMERLKKLSEYCASQSYYLQGFARK